jgi:D-serine deaminase-like pyridoxal phosphate-dependent protein
MPLIGPGSQSPVGLRKDELDTPALVVDLDAFDRNVGRMRPRSGRRA